MIAIGAIEPVIAIGPARDQLNSAEFTKLVLNRAESESAHPHQLAHVTLLSRRREKQSQDFGANLWKQDLEDLAFWLQRGQEKRKLDCFKQSSLNSSGLYWKRARAHAVVGCSEAEIS